MQRVIPISASEAVHLDKYERSPNHSAKCRGCNCVIIDGDLRIGLCEYIPDYQKYEYIYYHERCCPAEKKENIRLPSSPNPNRTQPIDEVLKGELEQQNKAAIQATNIVYRERAELREALRRLRADQAQRFEEPLYRIFSNKTLDDIVLKMPQSKEELLLVNGIGPAKCRLFAKSILRIVDEFRSAMTPHQRETAPLPQTMVTPQKQSGQSNSDGGAPHHREMAPLPQTMVTP
jgi:superfamily II DNA helicase RecQ